jgi:3-hydroxyisobutyrate dehydrogenase
MHVGIVGAGKMGSAIARNLLDRGYEVSVWNVDRAMMEPLGAAGATLCDDLELMVGGADVAIAMLWDDHVAREISLRRVVPAAGKGRLVVEMSTLSPQMYDTLAEAAAEREVHFLAAPVLGSIDGARSGTLTLLPGGTREAFEHGKEILAALGSTMKFTGSPAASGHLKLAFNCILGVLADSIGELLGVMGRAGVDRTLAIETLMQAIERVATKRQQLLDRDMAPRFSANALLKDLQLARASRESLHVDAPLMERALAEFESALRGGIGNEDYIAVGLAFERGTAVSSGTAVSK